MSQPPYGGQYDPQYGQQPPYGQSGAAPAQVNNNLTISIVGLLLFWPVGLIALLSATKVNNLAAQGNVAEAQAEADKAKKFGKIAIIVGACVYALSILACCGLVGLGALSGSSSSSY